MTRAAVLAGLFLVYALVPGYPMSLFNGVPLADAGLVACAVGSVALLFFWRATIAVVLARRLTIGIVLLTLAKVALATAPRSGWLSQQYANERFQGPAQASAGSSLPGATRIDRRIDFAGHSLPVSFLNDSHDTRGTRREVALPLSIRWTGYIKPERAATRTITLTARGNATLLLDGAPLIWIAPTREPATVTKEVTFTSGYHFLTFGYAKPADTDPLIALHGFEDPGIGDMLVTPAPAETGPRHVARWAGPLAAALDAFALGACVAFAWLLVASARRAGHGARSPLRWRALRMDP